MKYIHFTLAALFLLFTIVQFNDPDPILWIVIYGAMVALCVMAALKIFYPKVMMVQAALYLVYCGLLWTSASQWLMSDNKAMLFDEVAKMENLYIEESREFLGLVICLVVLGWYLWLSMRGKKQAS